ncbi:hypothetical protein Tco_0212287 [Tanacetum coccineum]
MAPRGRPTRTTRSRPVTTTPPPVTTTPPPVTDPTTTTSVTSAQLQAMIDEGVTAVLAARAATRNGDDSHTSGTGARRNERTIRECTYQDFMKCQPVFFRVENQVKFATCTLMGTALTWWNSHARTVTNDVAYAMTWMFPEETDKNCKDNVCLDSRLQFTQVYVASKPKTMQEAIEMATGLMERRINTLAERQTENKRKLEDALSKKPKQANQNKKAEYRQGLCCQVKVTGNRLKTRPVTTKTTTTAIPIITTTETTTTKIQGQIQMPSFASSVGLQATSGATAPSGRARIKEMVAV